MANVIISEKNKEKIENMVAAEQVRCRERCLTYQGIVTAIEKIEKHFCGDLGVCKKDLEGLTVSVDLWAQNFPNCYRGRPESTQFDLLRQGGKWRLIKVIRYHTRTAGNDFRCSMPETLKTAILLNAGVFE